MNRARPATASAGARRPVRQSTSMKEKNSVPAHHREYPCIEMVLKSSQPVVMQKASAFPKA